MRGSAMTCDELVLHEAEGWSTDGFWPIPVHAGSKKPVGDRRQHQRLTLPDLPSKFEKGSNVGVLLGIRPRVIVGVDCDSPEAIACAKLIRGPETRRIFGRRSKPCSHYLFELGAEFETMQFKDLDGKMIAEMRGKAGTETHSRLSCPAQCMSRARLSFGQRKETSEKRPSQNFTSGSRRSRAPRCSRSTGQQPAHATTRHWRWQVGSQ